MVEFDCPVPGNFTLLDHSIFRMEKGAIGFLKVRNGGVVAPSRQTWLGGGRCAVARGGDFTRPRLPARTRAGAAARRRPAPRHLRLCGPANALPRLQAASLAS